MPGLRIRICIGPRCFLKPDPDPHWTENLDQIQNSGALKKQNGAMEPGRSLWSRGASKMEPWRFCGPDRRFTFKKTYERNIGVYALMKKRRDQQIKE